MSPPQSLAASPPAPTPTADPAAGPLRVVVLLNRLANGGTPSRVLELSRHLNPRVELTVVVFSQDSPELLAEYRAAGIAVEVLDGKASPRSVVRLRELLRRLRPDVLHTFLPFAGWVGRLVARWCGVPSVVSSHQSVRGNYRPLVRALDGATMHLADHVVCNSEEVERSFFGTYTPFDGRGRAPRVVTVTNGIDLERIERAVSPAGREAVRAELGAAPGDFVVVSVGRFMPVKDHPTTLRAFAGMAAGAWLWLLGWGECEAELRALAAELGVADRVRFVVGSREVPRYLAGADAFVLASHKEGLSGALVEAMAAGLPPVVSDIPQNLFVIDGGAGLSFPVGDPGALGAALERLRADPALRGQLAAGARQAAVERFSIRRVADSFMALYQGCTAGRGARSRE